MAILAIYILVLILCSVYGEILRNTSTSNHGFIKKDKIELARADDSLYQQYLRRYFTYGEIKSLVEIVVRDHPDQAQMKVIGKSFEQRDLILVKLSNNFQDCKKVTFVEAGMQGNFWIGPAIALHTIMEVLKDPRLLATSDWYIVPLVNPDGYQYTHSSPEFRHWHKTRSNDSSLFANSTGADLNLNFDKHRMTDKEMKSLGPDHYHGGRSLSELEAQAIATAVLEVKSRVETYITIQEHGNLIFYPYGYTDKSPRDWVELERCGLAARKLVKEDNGPDFKVSSYFKAHMYKAGGVIDYMKDEMEIPFPFIIQPQGEGELGDHLPQERIFHVTYNTFLAIKALSQCSARYY